MAIAITFRRDDQNKVFVEHEWPQFALIAMIACNNAAMSDGLSSPIMGPNKNGLISIRCENGYAIYAVKQLISEAVFVCELIGSHAIKSAA